MLILAYIVIVVGLIGILLFEGFSLKTNAFEAGEYVLVLLSIVAVTLAGVYIIASHMYNVS